MLVWACIGFMSSLILIIGIYRDIKCLLIPWTFVVVIMIFLDLTHTAYLFAYESTKFEPMTAILFTLDFFHITLTVYSLLCVVSLYQEYKAGRGTADFEYLNRRVPGVRYAPQPTGTSFLSTRRAVTYHETRASPTGSPPHDRTASQRKHVQFGDDRTWLAPPPPSVIHIESPKDSVSSELNGRSGASPSEEGNSSGEWPGMKAVIDTEPLIGHGKPQITN
ncbi:Hypothetical protein NTJ_11649 [Nesidiocoris tenuis]|uniref:MARVEL domain-containing protein n=1 Tax=Nesidiocoris tenuis TaxID=355587 RepID=A0ABN7B370_9HEMI|nr:Hypothetical protein NTJ_11649 [Nesidiocoris tenuis]